MKNILIKSVTDRLCRECDAAFDMFVRHNVVLGINLDVFRRTPIHSSEIGQQIERHIGERGSP